MGPRVGHSEECRDRVEQAIAKDVGDERPKKAKERIDHYMGQRVEDGEDRSAEKEKDPRGVSLYPQHRTRLARRDRHPKSSRSVVRRNVIECRVLTTSMINPLQ